MAKKLVFYGNETLKSVAEVIKNINGEVIDLIDSMYNVMYKEKGIGLAAPQVEIPKRLLILDLDSYDGPAYTIINPAIKESSTETESYEEGCLSLPGINMEVVRPSSVLVTGITLDEKEIVIEAHGLLARVLQHEIDHLNGVLLIDHLEDYLKLELRSQLKKIKRMNKG